MYVYYRTDPRVCQADLGLTLQEQVLPAHGARQGLLHEVREAGLG